MDSSKDGKDPFKRGRATWQKNFLCKFTQAISNNYQLHLNALMDAQEMEGCCVTLLLFIELGKMSIKMLMCLFKDYPITIK